MRELKEHILDFWTDILLNIPNIGEHSLTVGVISYFIAKEFFTSEEFVFLAKAGGILHDIGYILPHFAPKLYTIEELYTILDYSQAIENDAKTLHTLVGGYILSNFLNLKDFADVAQYHHTPAPELDPHEITHIIANIVAVADVISMYIENTEPSICKELSVEILKANKGLFFKEVYEAAISAFSKDYLWWILQDPETLYVPMRLESKLEVKKLELDEELEEMGHFTSYIVDSKSAFTRRHTEGVALYSRELGKELSLPPDVQRYIYIAGLFHDIGKMAIDTSILEKPGPLTKSEYWNMKKHVYYTEKFLYHFEKAGYIWPKWAYQHHERVDGSGYPRKLTLKDLDIESRILQVADIFVAFIEERPYRDAMSQEKALSIVKNEVDNGRLDGEVYLALERLVKNRYTLPETTMIQNIIEEMRMFLEALEG